MHAWADQDAAASCPFAADTDEHPLDERMTDPAHDDPAPSRATCDALWGYRVALGMIAVGLVVLAVGVGVIVEGVLRLLSVGLSGCGVPPSANCCPTALRCCLWFACDSAGRVGKPLSRASPKGALCVSAAAAV